MEERPEPAARPGANSRARRGLRRLPHRPACRRRRTAATRSCRSCRATRSSAGSRRWARASTLALGARVGVPWLGHACGHCPYCRSGRENLCDTPLFTGYTRDGGFATHTVADAAFAFPLAGGPRSGRGRAAALRRPDRLALAQGGRRRADDRPLRLRRRGAYRRPGLPLAGPARLRLHPPRRRGRHRRSPARSARNGRAARTSAARAARRGDPVRAGRRARARRARGGAQGRPRRLRRHPHERHPVLPLPAPVGGAQRRLGRQPHPRRRQEFLDARAAREGADDDDAAIRSSKANEALDDLRAGRLEGAAVLVP